MAGGFFGFDDDGTAIAHALLVGSDVGAGTKIDRIRKVTAAVNPAEIAAVETGDTAVEITGVAAGDVVLVNPPALEAGLVFGGAFVSDTDEVTVRIGNITAGAIDAASATWTFFIVQFA